jgi:hypothetical protein
VSERKNGKNRNKFCPTFLPGKDSQESAVYSQNIVESTRMDLQKSVLVNTPTLTWVYTWAFKERGIKDRSTSVVSSTKRDAIYLKWKIKN